MYEDLTQKQIEVLLYIKSEIQRQGYPPAVREICKGLEIKSTSTVHSHLEKLMLEGYIRKDPAKPRAIEILDKNDDFLLNKKKTVDVPILSKITLKDPILSIENIEDTYPVSLELIKENSVFILKVDSESMIDAGILKNDLILVQEQSNAENGDIVVALLDDRTIIKRLLKEKDTIGFQPENQSMNTIYSKDAKLIGKVIALFRKI